MNVSKYSSAGIIRDCKIVSIIAENDNLFALGADLIIYHYAKFKLAAKYIIRENYVERNGGRMFLIKFNNMLIICDDYGNSKYIYNIRTQILLLEYVFECQFIQNPAGNPITFKYNNGIIQLYNLADLSRRNYKIDILTISKFSRIVFAANKLFATNSTAIFEITHNGRYISGFAELEIAHYVDYCGGKIMTLGGNQLEIYFGDNPLPLIKNFTVLHKFLQKCIIAIFLAIGLPRDIIFEIILRIA